MEDAPLLSLLLFFGAFKIFLIFSLSVSLFLDKEPGSGILL